MSARWAAFPPVTDTITCAGAEHRIMWRAGELHLHDHDAEAEQVLEVFGGEPPPCVQVARAWRGISDAPPGFLQMADPRVPPGNVDIGHQRAHLEGLFRTLAATSGANRVVDAEGREVWILPRKGANTDAPPLELRKDAMLRGAISSWHLTVLWRLSDPMRARAVAEAVYTIGERPAAADGYAEDPLADLLQDAVRAYCEESRWAGIAGVRWPVVRTVRMLAPGSPATVRTGGRTQAIIEELGLPLRWLADVWARGIAVVDGCFVLDVSDVTDDRIDAGAIRWEERARALVPVASEVALARVGGAWKIQKGGAS